MSVWIDRLKLNLSAGFMAISEFHKLLYLTVFVSCRRRRETSIGKLVTVIVWLHCQFGSTLPCLNHLLCLLLTDNELLQAEELVVDCCIQVQGTEHFARNMCNETGISERDRDRVYAKLGSHSGRWSGWVIVYWNHG